MAEVISLKTAKIKKHKKRMNQELVQILGEEYVLDLVEFYDSYGKKLDAQKVHRVSQGLQDLQKATGTDGKSLKS